MDEDILVEGRPIVAGPAFHTSGISEILHCTMELIQFYSKIRETMSEQ